MCDSLSSFLRSLSRSLVVYARVVAHHEVAERIDDEQRVLARFGKLRQQCGRFGRGRIERDEPGLFAREIIRVAAVAGGEEHALHARHLVVERQSRLAAENQRGAAGVVTAAVTYIKECPLARERLGIGRSAVRRYASPSPRVVAPGR